MHDSIVSMLRSVMVIALASAAAARQTRCKTTPLDDGWPSASEWSRLNASIGGVLLKTQPAASSCYPGNPFGSPLSCAYVEDNWTDFTFQESIPDGMCEPTWANSSCLPPSSAGYLPSKGCSTGGLPLYAVNATSEEQIGTAMKWASCRNIRIVVKGTGHEINGR